MGGILRARRLAYRAFIWLVNAVALRLPGNLLRVGVLRLCGARVGPGTRVERGVKVDFPWRLRIGVGSTINPGVYLDCRGATIQVGDLVDISSEAIVYTLTHDVYGPGFDVRAGPVELADSVWICARAIVLPGSSIGRGSVVAANSVIKGRVPGHQLWQGNPAVYRKDLPADRGSVRRK